MKIAIPSANRAKNVLTAEWLKKASIFCPEDQAEDYKKHNPENEIIGVPLTYKNITQTRNFIIQHYQGANADISDVVMLDDDIRAVGYHEANEMEQVNEDYFLDFCEDMFLMCKELGTVVWGVNMQSDKKFYREYSPFSFNSVVCATLMGIVKNDFKFDERFWLKEDFDYCIQVLNKYRKILRNNKWFYLAEHLKTEGGCSKDRTMEAENEQMELLVKKWGGRLVTGDRDTQGGRKSTNPIIKVPIRGI